MHQCVGLADAPHTVDDDAPESKHDRKVLCSRYHRPASRDALEVLCVEAAGNIKLQTAEKRPISTRITIARSLTRSGVYAAIRSWSVHLRMCPCNLDSLPITCREVVRLHLVLAGRL